MYEIIGETIKSATSIKLGEIFGTDIKRYKETIINMEYPNFFIEQLSANIEPDTRKRAMITYLISIRYRIAKDITNITTVNQQLDKIALKLMTEFTELQLERPIKVKNVNYEKQDGVLHFFFNVTIQIMKYEELEALQEKLSINKNIIEKEEKE